MRGAFYNPPFLFRPRPFPPPSCIAWLLLPAFFLPQFTIFVLFPPLLRIFTPTVSPALNDRSSPPSLLLHYFWDKILLSTLVSFLFLSLSVTMRCSFIFFRTFFSSTTLITQFSSLTLSRKSRDVFFCPFPFSPLLSLLSHLRDPFNELFPHT